MEEERGGCNPRRRGQQCSPPSSPSPSPSLRPSYAGIKSAVRCSRLKCCRRAEERAPSAARAPSPATTGSVGRTWPIKMGDGLNKLPSDSEMMMEQIVLFDVKFSFLKKNIWNENGAVTVPALAEIFGNISARTVCVAATSKYIK